MRASNRSEFEISLTKPPRGLNASRELTVEKVFFQGKGTDGHYMRPKWGSMLIFLLSYARSYNINNTQHPNRQNWNTTTPSRCTREYRSSHFDYFQADSSDLRLCSLCYGEHCYLHVPNIYETTRVWISFT